MATLNANPTVYAPLTIERHSKSHSKHQQFEASLKQFPFSSDAFSTLLNVPIFDSKRVETIDDTFSFNKFTSDRQTNNGESAESGEPWDSLEVFDLVRSINDPEHPLTLEALKVLQLELIDVKDEDSSINLRFTPTIPHCSMATLIGLCIRVKLIRSLPARFKVDVSITPGAHATEDQINKQLNDKERVAAALENNHLLDIVNKCLATK